MLALSAPLDCVPVRARLPPQPFEAAHDVAFFEDQLSVAALPLPTVLGVAVSVTVGVTFDTLTVVDCVALPPAPVQVTAKVLAAVSAPVDFEPKVPSEPLQPPDAVQDRALVDDQVRLAALPLATVAGLADRLTVGDAAGLPEPLTVTMEDCVALPPGPLQVSE